jgi:hypothetical protein
MQKCSKLFRYFFNSVYCIYFEHTSVVIVVVVIVVVAVVMVVVIVVVVVVPNSTQSLKRCA